VDSSKLNSWLTLAANIGVLVGLLLLVVEIRQNTAASQAQTAQAIIDSSRNFLVGIAMDEDFARIREAGQSDISSLSDSDAYRFAAYSRGNWLYFQNVWIQWTLGVVDDRIWWTIKEIICEIQSQPGNLEEWAQHRGVLNQEFVEIVDSCTGKQ
jgi:hypothetical protein